MDDEQYAVVFLCFKFFKMIFRRDWYVPEDIYSQELKRRRTIVWTLVIGSLNIAIRKLHA